MTKRLFDAFEPVSAKQWKQKIQFDLKGADYNSALIWESLEGIKVKPFYHADDFDKPFATSDLRSNTFKICETIYVNDAEKSNRNAIRSVKGGAECIKFIVASESIRLDILLKDLPLDEISIFLEFEFLSDDLLKSLSSLPTTATINTGMDIIGNLATSGNWFLNMESDFSKFTAIVRQSKSFAVHVAQYQNAGANIIQELAYTLSHLNEYFNHFENKFSNGFGSDITVTVNVAVGSNYFFEIAKLRALKLLVNSLKKEYALGYNIQIFAVPSKRNKTIYDYNTNMLRTTTECMSAILGGADIVCNLPYDVSYHKTNEFSSRIARNQLLILKHESYFDDVENPADGSYYIESLTDQIAKKALEVFKTIEASGGFLKQLHEGTVQRKIKESARKAQALFDDGKIVLLGSNKYPNNEDKMKHELELYPFVKRNPRKTLIEPILEKRLTETLEQERLKTE